MYSGGDSSAEGVNSNNQYNWQMASQPSCNVNSGSIDWASLAQQWIQMKDSGAGLPEAPPPPIISTANSMRSIQPPTTKLDEQGEADMEVEREDEVQIIGFGHNSPPILPQPNRWVPIAAQPEDTVGYCPQPTWTWPARVALPPPVLHVPMAAGPLAPPVTTPPLQKPLMDIATMVPEKGPVEQVPMDAAKRKILPAWIREGLEKMEREKLKQLERSSKDKDSIYAGTAAAEESDINNFKSMVKSSITEMEGESSGNEDDTNTAQRPDDIDGDSIVAFAPNMLTSDLSESYLNSGKTYEERVADMMIGVRKTLTELLLEVTNEEIINIANEAIRKRREKASSVQVFRKSAIPSITGKLGLEAYADSDSENSASDNDTTNDESKRSDDDYDSEEELKANIRICQRTFMKTIEEIEDKIEANALRDEKLLREHRKEESNNEEITPEPIRSEVQQKNKGFDKEIGEPLQPDKKSNSNGKRKKERTSRFSDNKDSRNRNMAASFYQPPAMGSGNLPTPLMSGSLVLPTSNYMSEEFRPRIGGSSLAALSSSEKRSSSISTSKSSKQTNSYITENNQPQSSDSSSSSSNSSSSSTSTSHSKRSKYSDSRRNKSSRERSKRSEKISSYRSRSHRSSSHRSSSHRSSRRRSSDSNDDDGHSKRSSHRSSHKSHSSSKYSRRNDRRRSDSRSSRSRTRSRSRSRSTNYSSSRRVDRH